MPSLWLVVITLRIWRVFPSRTRLRTAWVAMSTSYADTMPPPIFGTKRCAITPDSEPANCMRICA